jgi:hypothetical protein
MRKLLLAAVPICVVGLIAGVVLASGAGDRAKARAKPVAKAPGLLLGNARLESHHDTLGAGRWAAFRFRASAGGSGRWVNLFVDRRTRSKSVQIAIYRDSHGHPGARMTSGSKRAPVAGGWNHIAVKAVRLVRGHDYWLAIVGTGGSLSYRDRTKGSCDSYQSAHQGLGALPMHWTGRVKLHRCALSATAVSRLTRAAVPAPPPPSTPPPTTTPPPPTTPVSQTKNCASQPSACGFPDATNSGLPAGTPLTPVGQASLPSGVHWDGQNMSITSDGVTLSNLSIPGSINIAANNVTIKNSLIDDPSGDQAIDIQDSYRGTVVENTTISGSNTGTGAIADGIQGNGVTVTSVYVHFVEEAVNGGGNTVTNSYLVSDGLHEPVATDNHNESIDVGDGTSQAEVIEHNTLFNPVHQTAAIIAGGPWGQLQNVTIDNNLMAGGGYTLYCCETTAWNVNQAPANTSITNNRFSRLYYKNGGSYGPLADLDTSHTKFTGNVWDDTLKAVTP